GPAVVRIDQRTPHDGDIYRGREREHIHDDDDLRVRREPLQALVAPLEARVEASLCVNCVGLHGISHGVCPLLAPRLPTPEPTWHRLGAYSASLVIEARPAVVLASRRIAPRHVARLRSRLPVGLRARRRPCTTL